MSDHPDLRKANHALQVLRQARLSRNEAAAVMIGDLIYEIAYTGQRSPEIEDAHQTAWLAISELARALKKERFAHMRRNKLATIEATPQAQDAWGTHVSEVVNGTLLPGTNSWYMGANIAGKARRFLPYLGPEGVGGYRRKCAEVAEKGYEGFVFASQGLGGTAHTIAAE